MQNIINNINTNNTNSNEDFSSNNKTNLNYNNFIEEYAVYAYKNHFYQKLKQNYQKMLYSLKFLINYIWSEQAFLKSKIISEKIIEFCR